MWAQIQNLLYLTKKSDVWLFYCQILAGIVHTSNFFVEMIMKNTGSTRRGWKKTEIIPKNYEFDSVYHFERMYLT